MQAKPPAVASATLVMQPVHANSAGFVHGGEIMKLVDTTAGVASMRHCNGRVVTAHVDSLSFHAPVHIGDLVTVEAVVTQSWRSSMEVEVGVLREDPRFGTQEHTTTAFLAMVAVDDGGNPLVVPPVIAESEAELRRQSEANVRREERVRVRRRVEGEAG